MRIDKPKKHTIGRVSIIPVILDFYQRIIGVDYFLRWLIKDFAYLMDCAFYIENIQKFWQCRMRDYAPNESGGRCFGEKRFFKIVMKS